MNTRNVIVVLVVKGHSLGHFSEFGAATFSQVVLWGGRRLKRQTLCLKMKSIMKCRHVSDVLLLTVIQWVCLARASHFRHGNIAWAPVDSYSDTVRCTQPYTLRQCFIVNPHEFLECASGQNWVIKKQLHVTAPTFFSTWTADTF